MSVGLMKSLVSLTVSLTVLQLPEGESCIEQLLKRMRQLTEEAQVEMTQEELLKRFQRVEDQNAECQCLHCV